MMSLPIVLWFAWGFLTLIWMAWRHDVYAGGIGALVIVLLGPMTAAFVLYEKIWGEGE